MTQPSRKQVGNALLGNFFEHYDTALFGFLSPFLAPLIFPKHDPLTALILTYALVPIGMFARPLGSLVFGYLGDLMGRQFVLSVTLIGMGFLSGGMALLPLYDQIGALAPILFCCARALQNFLAGGETMGGAAFILESAPSKHHDFLSGVYSASTIAGHLLASLGVFLISYNFSIQSGWRFLYLFGCVTMLFGYLLRRKDNCSAKPEQFSYSLSELMKAFWISRKSLLLLMITSGYACANYYIALVLMNGFIPLVSTISKTQIMAINSYLLIFDCCALPLFGWIASKVSREKLMLTASIAVTIFAIPLSSLLEGASLTTVIGIRTFFVLTGVAFFAPFYAWSQQIIPPTYRYAIMSFGYALGSQLIGDPTVALSLWCFKKTGIVSSVSWILVSLAIASSLAIILTKKIQNTQTVKN